MGYYKSELNKAWRRNVRGIRDCTYADPHFRPRDNWCCEDTKCKHKNQKCHIHTNCGRKSCDCCMRVKCNTCGYNADNPHPSPIYDEDKELFTDNLIKLLHKGFWFNYDNIKKIYTIERIKGKQKFYISDPNEIRCVMRAYLKVFYGVSVGQVQGSGVSKGDYLNEF